MIKTILMILLLALMVLDIIVVIFSKHLVSGLKSQDIQKRIKAEDMHSKINLIGYIAFFVLMILFIVITKVF